MSPCLRRWFARLLLVALPWQALAAAACVCPQHAGHPRGEAAVACHGGATIAAVDLSVAPGAIPVAHLGAHESSNESAHESADESAHGTLQTSALAATEPSAAPSPASADDTCSVCAACATVAAPGLEPSPQVVLRAATASLAAPGATRDDTALPVPHPPPRGRHAAAFARA